MTILRRWWTALALLALNTLAVFAAANLIALGVLAWRGGAARPGPVPPSFIAGAIEKAFPSLDAAERADLVRESSMSFIYEPFTQFRERPCHGRFVNVETAGYRRSADQGPWPPDPANRNVFLFGSSTTFNYGAPATETIASHLQRQLADGPRPVRVYNFGRGGYYSSQELTLFERLLTAGFVPDDAVFVDGGSDFETASRSSIPPASSLRGRGNATG